MDERGTLRLAMTPLWRFARPACSWLVVGLVLAPLLALLVEGSAGVLAGHLESRVLRLAGTTLLLAGGSTVLASMFGVGSAWLVENCEFPGRKLFAFALFLPFAVPPYLLAYVWSDLVDDGGWLPPGVGVRNLAGACLVMSLVLYPYVYMFARASFAQRSSGLLVAARLLGCTPWGAFWRTAVPLARPAIAVGGLLVFMEVANDIAVAEDYGLQTLGYYIYDLWLNRDQRSAAAAVSMLMMVMALVLALGEFTSRRRQRQYQQGVRCYCSDYSYRLSGSKGMLAMAWCATLFGFAFAVPVVTLGLRVVHSSTRAMWAALAAAADTLLLAAMVVVLSFCLGGLLVAMRRWGGGAITKVLTWLALLGYAFPGIIYALGAILAVSAAATWLEAQTGWLIHWLWTTTVCLLVFALASRFVTISWGALETGLTQVPPKYAAVARSAGKSWWATLLVVYLPMMRPALFAGGILLLVDVIKELPLVLVLRPFGTDTLSLLVFQHASDEDLVNSAPAALLMLVIAAVGLALAYRWMVPAWVKPRR